MRNFTAAEPIAYVYPCNPGAPKPTTGFDYSNTKIFARGGNGATVGFFVHAGKAFLKASEPLYGSVERFERVFLSIACRSIMI